MNKNLEIALCDTDSEFIIKFANHVMTRGNSSVHIFTTTEGFFQDENDFDVTILTEEFEEISAFKPKGNVGHKYYLCEDSFVESEDYIYKYQSVDLILDEVVELRKIGMAKAGAEKSGKNSKLLGIYSPNSHELQLPFSMALCQSLKAQGQALFIDLEEISIMSYLIGNTLDRNLMDLLYDINTNSKGIDLSMYARSFMGFDYIEPFLNPNEISEIDEEIWNSFFEILLKSDYEVVVVLFGRTVSGFSRLISKLNRLYVLGRSGDFFRKGQEVFMEYLERIQADIQVENVILPMSAGNLSDGAYQIEELLQGNLGMFVRKMMNSRGQNSLENYG